VRRLQTADEVTDLLGLYVRVERASRVDRPWVLGNMVGGLDGSAAVAGRVGELSTPADARLFRELRSVPDVVLVGAETVRRERYGPVRLDASLEASRLEAGRAAAPTIAVLSRSLDIDWSIPLFADTDGEARPLIITCASAPRARQKEARAFAEVVLAGDDSVDLGSALHQLRQRGTEVVLCEGGPTLLGQLAGTDLLDELCLTLTPLMGGDPLPLALTPPGAGRSRYTLGHAVVDDDGTLFLRYERDRAR
jgi:riboflavin biosynthesis pyrimidine reductase